MHLIGKCPVCGGFVYWRPGREDPYCEVCHKRYDDASQILEVGST